MSGRRRRLTALIVAATTLPAIALAGSSPAQAAQARPFDDLRLPASVRTQAPATGLAPSLRSRTGTVEVSVLLSEAAVAEVVADGATATDTLPSRAVQTARLAAVRSEQSGVAAKAAALGAKVTGRATRAGNVLTMRAPAGRLTALAAIPGVLSVKPVAKYSTTEGEPGSGSLDQAIDYLGARALHEQGVDGTGVRVAVLDSGIDYTHENLGGPGTVEAYAACYGDADDPRYDAAPVGACADLFGPGAPKVKGGYDFVGEVWPGTGAEPTPVVETPDPNPIDLEGHGTHVADISTGRSADGTHEGLAPGADVYAVKVCSAVASACSGVALLQGVDWAMDPNGDGDISDAVDIMNLSLGSDYGQPQDDLSLLLNNAVAAGVTVVASAGNAADRPFIVGSPSTAARVISVAQTSLPDDSTLPVVVDSPVIPALPDNTVKFSVLQSWSPPFTSAVTGQLVVPSDPTRLGCTPADFATFPAGAVALIQRGTCNATTKAFNAAEAGASAVVIYNNVPGDPPSFSSGGETVTAPTLTISQARGQVLAAAVAAGPVTVTIDPANAIALPNTMVGTSSRGPRMGDELTKPDIGAPGAWLSAEAGTGAEETNFGGTSGAAPTVSGVAALVIDRYPWSPPSIVKSRLLNGADSGNTTLDGDGNPYPTPISRVGAGEVRAAGAVRTSGILTNTQLGAGNVGLGLPHLTRTTSYPVRLTLRNNGAAPRVYDLATTFRDPADAASGAVTVTGPKSVTVPAKAGRTVTFTVTIDPAKLAAWPFTYSAGRTGDGSALNGPEFDGLVTATWRGERLHLGWQVLPQRSADVSATGPVTLRKGAGTLSLRNASAVQDGPVDVYGLTGTSGKLPRPKPGDPGSPGSNQALVDLKAVGVADFAADDVIGFALAGHERNTVPSYPAGYEVDVDVDRDGTFDYAIFQGELNGFGATGQTVVYVVDLNDPDAVATPYFFTQGDFDSSTVVFYAPLSVMGLSAGDTFDFDVLAYDNYFSGEITDVVEGMAWTVGESKYSLVGASLSVPAGASGSAPVTLVAGGGPSSETGLLLLHGTARSADSEIVKVVRGS